MAELVPAKQKLVQMRALLGKQQNEIAKAIPRGLDAQRFVRAVLTVFARTPKLLDCTPQSVLAAVMQAAQLGLELDPGMGQAYLVPYGNQCQMITGYQGLVTLAMRTPDVKSVVARAVYEKDFFEYELGLNERLVHKPSADADKGALTFVYGVAKLVDRDGMVPVFEVMSRKEVDAIRARSRAKDSGPWVTDYEMMSRKTVVRRLSKWLPKSTDFGRAIAAEDRFEMGATGRDGVEQMVDELMQEPPIETKAIEGSTGSTEPTTSSLDQLADKMAGDKTSPPPTTASAQPVQKPAPEKTAQDAPQTTKPAQSPSPKPEFDPRPDAPPSPLARDLAKAEQASRHEVPRAHQPKKPAAAQGPAPQAAAPPPAEADGEMTSDEIDWGSNIGRQREPGEEG